MTDDEQIEFDKAYETATRLDPLIDAKLDELEGPETGEPTAPAQAARSAAPASDGSVDAGRERAAASMRAILGRANTEANAAAGQSAQDNMIAQLRQAGIAPNLLGHA